MGFDKIVMGIDEVERVLQLAPILGKPQGLAGQAAELLAQGQVVPLDIGRVDLPPAPIGASQGGRLGLHLSRLAKDDAPGHLHHAPLLSVLVDLSIAQLRRGDPPGGTGAPGPACRAGAGPHPEDLEEDFGIVPQSIRGEHGERAVQTPADSADQTPGAVEGAIADHGGQTQAILGRHGPPDPGAAQAAPAAPRPTQRGGGVIVPGGSGCFF